MRGADIQQDTLFSTVIPEERVPKDHPLRPIREEDGPPGGAGRNPTVDFHGEKLDFQLVIRFAA
jgi:hypothetical protein